ncbi:MAG TPA: DNA-3-methyladenine glycosylase I [Dongiaceae bacterium]|nr:DNA-3-methyladenine glycosylase I [Dongiaceae bacterium]
MSSFKKIHTRALERKGGPKALAAWLPELKSKAQLSRIPDHRYLAEMARCVFQAGFVWRVIDQKWPGFEAAFFGFKPDKLILMAPEQWEAIGRDTRVVRNMQKIMSVARNAQFILDVAQEHGSFAKLVANWPQDDLIGLLEFMKKNGDRLGGVTGMRILRNMGKDSFVLSQDVLVCLKGAGADIDKGTSKRELKLIQQTFNQWHAESGLPYSHLSRICSCSVGENYNVEAFDDA